MKVMKVIDKKVGDIVYYKYRINLPKETVEELNFIDIELQVKNENGRLVIEKVIKDEIKSELTPKQKRLQKELLNLIKNKNREG